MLSNASNLLSTRCKTRKLERLDNTSSYKETLSKEDFATYASLLKRHGKTQSLVKVKRTHAHILKHEQTQDVVLMNLLIQAYGKCGSLNDGLAVFDEIHRNVFSWNILIAACVHCGNLYDARDLFEKMPERNMVSWNTIVTAYAQHGALEDALYLFYRMPERDAFSWTAIITAHAVHGLGRNALSLFHQMEKDHVRPDGITFLSLLDACGRLMVLPEGKRIHSCILNIQLQEDTIVKTALLCMYSKCGSLEAALQVFNHMSETDEVSCSAIVTALVEHVIDDIAGHLLAQMCLGIIQPNKVNFVAILDACGRETSLAKGKFIYSIILSKNFHIDVVLGTCLINMYGKCGCLSDARAVFCSMFDKNVISWTAMIVAYIRNEHRKGAIELFQQMQSENLVPNKVSFISSLDACADEAAFAQGKWMHAFIRYTELESDDDVGTALVNMYGSCGHIEEAKKVFDNMVRPHLISWTTLVAIYGQHGNGNQALKLFVHMQKEGWEPDNITLGTVISACNHSSLIDEGCSSFVSATCDYKVTPADEQYNCMVNLLGHAGLLGEAEDLINSNFDELCETSWMALLSSCTIHLESG